MSSIPQKKDQFCEVFENGTLYQVLEEMFSKEIHRVPVMDDAGAIINILSQSDITQFMADNKRLWSSLGHKTVEQLSLGTDTVICMSQHACAIHAFYLMSFNKVTAVAVVDSDEKLVANISASDIRGLTQEKFGMLLLPITEFFAKLTGAKFKSALSVKKTSKLSDVIHLLMTYKVHRVWLVDDAERPIGLISITDVMKMLVREGDVQQPHRSK